MGNTRTASKMSKTISSVVRLGEFLFV